MLSIKASCVDSTAAPAAVFASEVEKLQRERFRPTEQLTLEPYERDHACVIGTYRTAGSHRRGGDAAVHATAMPLADGH
eukprot:ctg_2744.g584